MCTANHEHAHARARFHAHTARFKSRVVAARSDAPPPPQARTAFKGRVFSAPMDWSNMVKQLQEHSETHIVPLSGEALAARVQISIQGG